MSEDENEGRKVDNFTLGDSLHVEVEATESSLVSLRLRFRERQIVNPLLLYPGEAERIAKAMLRAVEHIKAKAGLTP